MNPGGLYGKVTPENFPYVNDYRNGVVAEGMKVLGFVNRYSRGVQAVQDELRTNGNGEADFKPHFGTAFLVMEKIAIKEPEKPRKEPRKELKKTLTDVLKLMRDNPRITYRELENKLGIKESAVLGRIRKLKELGLIKREGGRSSGVWIVIE